MDIAVKWTAEHGHNIYICNMNMLQDLQSQVKKTTKQTLPRRVSFFYMGLLPTNIKLVV